MSFKANFNRFFKTKGTTDEAIEFTRHFLVPFAKAVKHGVVDDVIAAFFAVEDRKFFWAKASREFKMPGKYYIAGNRPVYGAGPRKIKKGQTLLIAVDRKEGTARVEATIGERDCNFLLEKFEFETIKDWINVIE